MTLVDLHARLSSVYESIKTFDLPTPIIDLSPSHSDQDNTSRDTLPGLRFLRDEVKRDCDVLDKFLREPSHTAPSINAPYLIAVWHELLHAHQPVAIYRMFYPAHGQDRARRQSRIRAVKVDVVAENGARWVRVNTIKNARLMMEFREIDSYLTSDEDEGETKGGPRPRLAQTEFDNSVLKIGRELLAAAKANPISVPAPFSRAVSGLNSMALGSHAMITPHVTIRFTRLDPSLNDDTRIEKTIQYLRDMGIDVQLGERSYPHPSPVPKVPGNLKPLEPTTNINLDLSALIALVSDISHSPLPRTEQDAHTRFEPPQHYLSWKKDRVKSLARQIRSLCNGEDDEGDEGTWENSGQQSRALAAQTIQEMTKGILEEVHERLSAVATYSSIPLASVTFWTTSEARHRCLQIVSKIGGARERRRADALLGSTWSTRMPLVPVPTGMPGAAPGIDNAEGDASPDAYWGQSRYPAGFLPLAPIRIYSSIIPAVEEDRESRSAFFDALMRTCTQILSHEAMPAVSLVSAPLASSPPAVEDVLGEIPPAPQTSLPKLTVHTVMSMLAGTSRGYTTLTTNKSSVKAILKAMRRVCGRGVYEPDLGMGNEKAVLWILGPRSLSEGMRSE